MSAEPAADFGPRFRIRHLEIFWAVMRTGSQHEAARLLGLSQPAVSKLLRHVEDRVGVALFRRAKGRLVPTPEARLFLEAVDEIFSRVDAAERLARDLKRSFTGRLTLVAVPGLSASFVPSALGSFLRDQPDVRVGVTALPTAQIVDRILKQQADLGLLYGPIDATAAETQVVGEAAVVCALPPNHPLAKCPTLGPADLAGERIISAAYMPRWGQAVEAAFAGAGVERNIVVNCANSNFAFTLAAAGVGIAIVPMSPMQPGSEAKVALRRFEPQISLPILAVYRADEPLRMLASSLIDWLRAAAGARWDAEESLETRVLAVAPVGFAE